MNGTFCIDKRIGYLALFAVPLMVLTVFSLIVNSQRVTQSSRAEGRMEISPIIHTPSPTSIPPILTCLNIVGGKWVIPDVANKEIFMHIYGLKNKNVSNLALLNLDPKVPQDKPPLYGYEVYLGIQGTDKYPVLDDFMKCIR